MFTYTLSGKCLDLWRQQAFRVAEGRGRGRGGGRRRRRMRDTHTHTHRGEGGIDRERARESSSTVQRKYEFVWYEVVPYEVGTKSKSTFMVRNRKVRLWYEIEKSFLLPFLFLFLYILGDCWNARMMSTKSKEDRISIGYLSAAILPILWGKIPMLP